jgi:hypothetical protein
MHANMPLQMPKYATKTSKYAIKTKLFVKILQKNIYKISKKLDEGKNLKCLQVQNVLISFQN